MAEFDQELEPANDTVEEVASEEADPSTSAVAPATRQPAKKVNLDEFKEFRDYKSAEQRRSAEQERRFQAQLAQAQGQFQQQLAQYEQYAVANMDDGERSSYETQKERNLRLAAEKRLAELETQRNRATALIQIANEASEYLDFDIPTSAIEAAESPDQAWKLAAQYRKEQLQKQAAESDEAKAKREQKRAANKPDLGGGAPTIATDELERKLAAAFKNKDAALYNKLLRESKQRA